MLRAITEQEPLGGVTSDNVADEQQEHSIRSPFDSTHVDSGRRHVAFSPVIDDSFNETSPHSKPSGARTWSVVTNGPYDEAYRAGKGSELARSNQKKNTGMRNLEKKNAQKVVASCPKRWFTFISPSEHWRKAMLSRRIDVGDEDWDEHLLKIGATPENLLYSPASSNMGEVRIDESRPKPGLWDAFVGRVILLWQIVTWQRSSSDLRALQDEEGCWKECAHQHKVWKNMKKLTWQEKQQRRSLGEIPGGLSIFHLRLFNPEGTVVQLWAAWMTIFDLTFTAFVVPISTAHGSRDWENRTGSPFIIDFIGGIVYIFHMLMSLQSGITIVNDNRKTVIMDKWLVTKFYLESGRMIIDVLSIVPFIVFVSISGHSANDQNDYRWLALVSLVRLLRLIRYIDISKVVYVATTCNNRKSKNNFIKRILSVTNLYMVFLMYFIWVLINLEACLLLIAARMEGEENSWMNSVTWVDVPNSNNAYQWYSAIYFAITCSTTTGFGDFQPRTAAEQVLTNLYMILGMIIFGLLVGGMSNMLTRASAEASSLYTFKKRSMAVEDWMEDRELPDTLKRLIQAHYLEVWQSKNQGSCEGSILSELPSSIRSRVSNVIAGEFVSKVKCFSKTYLHDELRDLIAQHLFPVEVLQGEDLCCQGVSADRLWIVESGAVCAMQYKAGGIELQGPCVLGDAMAFMNSIPSARYCLFTYRARTPCNVWELSIMDFNSIVRMNPSIKEALLEHIRSELARSIVTAHKGGRGVVSTTASFKVPPAELKDDHGDHNGHACHPLHISQPSTEPASSFCEMACYLGCATTFAEKHGALDLDELSRQLWQASVKDGTLMQLLKALMNLAVHAPWADQYSGVNAGAKIAPAKRSELHTFSMPHAASQFSSSTTHRPVSINMGDDDKPLGRAASYSVTPLRVTAPQGMNRSATLNSKRASSPLGAVKSPLGLSSQSSGALGVSSGPLATGTLGVSSGTVGLASTQTQPTHHQSSVTFGVSGGPSASVLPHLPVKKHKKKDAREELKSFIQRIEESCELADEDGAYEEEEEEEEVEGSWLRPSRFRDAFSSLGSTSLPRQDFQAP